MFISGELNKRLELKHINLEKHLSKKVAHLLKSRPSLLASFHEELKDARQRSPKTLESELLPSPGSRWSSILMPHGKNGVLNLNIRLDSLGNQGLLTKKRKKHKSQSENGGAVVRVLKTLFFFGGLLVVLMMFACFAFAW